MLSGQGQTAGARLAGRLATVRGFDAVVEAVAHQVGERVDDPFGEALVQLRGFALGDQLYVFVELAGQVADQAREAAEHIVHRHHAHGHHRFLEIPGGALQQVEPGDQGAVVDGFGVLGHLVEHRLGDNQLADQVDDLIDLGHRHPDGGGFTAFLGAVTALGGGFGFRRGRRLGRGRGRGRFGFRFHFRFAFGGGGRRGGIQSAHFQLLRLGDKAHHRFDIVAAE